MADITVREEEPPPPLTAHHHVAEIDQPVQHQKPAQRKVPVAPTGEPTAEPDPRGRLDLLPGIPVIEGTAWPERGVCREDLQAAPRHEEEKRHVQPVGQADEPGLWASSLPPL